ncbi:LOW QUALITY PROTEIN: E3 ubiquitin-protein ligase TRIM11-like [Pituophis catenifer annectens]|uniref:LOW QUALITY PROTEIN: E3 ubiquitin-protein ligase TRIM11-like n=1 Tax=Pituophis catenifer annectens TaxID=94852 RepID=UPI0039956D23
MAAIPPPPAQRASLQPQEPARSSQPSEGSLSIPLSLQDRDLIKEVKKNGVAEFRELQLWLEGQEKLLLTQMEETEKDIMARKEKGLAKHMEELGSLDHLIQEIEEKLQQPASKLLQLQASAAGGPSPYHSKKEAFGEIGSFAANPDVTRGLPRMILWKVDFNYRKDLIKKVKKNVVAEFRELQLWLKGQEKLLLTRMEETEKTITARKEKGLAKHMEELGSLDHLIQEIEEKHQQPASKLLQDIGSTLKKYQAKKTHQNLLDLRIDPKRTIWDYRDMTVLLKRGMKKLRAQRRSPDLEEKKRNLTFCFFVPAEEAALAAEASFPVLLEEATCSICLDFFQDPVLIPECGHNFCRGCLTRSWGTSESEASCPQCRQTFTPHSLLPNRHLARMVEVARQCGDPRDEEGESLCPKHREPLKFFCKDHETLICVVCDRSKEHRSHSVIPAEEAFPEYQIKVEDCLKAQKEEKEKIATYKGDTEQTVQEMLELIKEVKKNVVAEFRELQLWLEGQEKLLLTQMEETEKDIMARKEKGLAKHMEELGSLDHLIQEIEEKLQQPASKLLQDIGSILKKYQAKETYENPVDLLLEPKWTIWDYSDIPAVLKSAMKKLRDTLESGLQVQEENVTLDPDTANLEWLEVSQDRKSVKGVKPFKEPISMPCVLGCQKFSTGRHFWEVIVGDREGWAVGVASKPLNVTKVDKQTMFWMFWKCVGKYEAISPSKRSDLVLTEEPTRIRISLNCEGGQVSFFDASTATLLHKFSDASLVGETLLPCFCLFKGPCLTLPKRRDNHKQKFGKIPICQAGISKSL